MAQLPDDFKIYMKKMKRLGSDILQTVVTRTINNIGQEAHQKSQENVRNRFMLRNKYTERSLRYFPAKPRKNWLQINAISGSTSDYMDEQDSGGFRKPKRGRKAPVVALAARGNKRGAVVRKKYRAGFLGENQFIGKPRGGGKNLGSVVGVYERFGKNHKLRMIRSLEYAEVKIQARHWHTDGMKFYTESRIRNEFIKQAEIEIGKLTRGNS